MGMGMFGGGGQKIDATVQFPLEGLDMSKYVKSNNGESMIYDCYAVSNHYGSMGFGHYTAYAKNPLTNKWYEFDDSRVSAMEDPSNVISNAAYNLFYRRRDWHQQNIEEGVDFDKLAN